MTSSSPMPSCTPTTNGSTRNGRSTIGEGSSRPRSSRCPTCTRQLPNSTGASSGVRGPCWSTRGRWPRCPGTPRRWANATSTPSGRGPSITASLFSCTPATPAMTATAGTGRAQARNTCRSSRTPSRRSSTRMPARSWTPARRWWPTACSPATPGCGSESWRTAATGCPDCSNCSTGCIERCRRNSPNTRWRSSNGTCGSTRSMRKT